MASIAKFGTDKTKEQEGVWVNAGADLELHIRRLGNVDYNNFIRKYSRTIGRAIRHGAADPETTKQLEAITTKAVANHVLVGWKNLQDAEGNDVSYTAEVAEKFLLEYPQFREMVLEFAQDADLFRTVDQEAAAGN